MKQNQESGRNHLHVVSNHYSLIQWAHYLVVLNQGLLRGGACKRDSDPSMSNSTKVVVYLPVSKIRLDSKKFKFFFEF